MQKVSVKKFSKFLDVSFCLNLNFRKFVTSFFLLFFFCLQTAENEELSPDTETRTIAGQNLLSSEGECSASKVL